MNIVALVGNLATDPELRRTSQGREVCSFRLAVSRPGGEQADFFSVVTWERQAQVCAEYLSIGRRVAVEGRLHQSAWDAEGGRRTRVEIIAHRVHMIGSRPRADNEPASAHAEVAVAPSG